MSILTFATNENGDWYMPDGRSLQAIVGAPALAQSLRQYGLMRKTENPFDVDEGVAYFETMFSPHKDLDAARVSITDTILSHPDVISIESLSMAMDNNDLRWVANISTIYGTVEVTNV